MSEANLLGQVYDILIREAGAPEGDRASFVDALLTGDCREWRFCGSLGFGGKYRPDTNTVDCYREDETPSRLLVIKKTNAALAALVQGEARGTTYGQIVLTADYKTRINGKDVTLPKGSVFTAYDMAWDASCVIYVNGTRVVLEAWDAPNHPYFRPVGDA